MDGMQLDMSNAQMIRDENGRPFIIVKEYAPPCLPRSPPELYPSIPIHPRCFQFRIIDQSFIFSQSGKEEKTARNGGRQVAHPRS